VLGRLFKEFAVTICVAILISGVVSVTLTPMLGSRFLRPPQEQRKRWFYRATEGFFERMLGAYDVSLGWVLRYRPVTVAVFLAVLGATIWMFVRIPKGFLPDQDTGQMVAVTEASEGTSYYQMVEYQKAIAETIQQDPSVDSLISSIGGSTATTLGAPNFGQIIAHLKPRGQRRMLVEEIMERLRPQLSGFPGMRVYLQNPPTIQIGGQVTKSVYQFSLQAPDKPELYAAAEKLEEEIAQNPGLQDVTSNLQIRTPQVNLTIDRDRAAALEVNAQQIENALYDAYGPRWVSTIYAAINEYKVLLELEPQYQKDPRALSLLYFKSAGSQLIPLDSLARLAQESGPQAISHYGQLPAVTISFNVKPGVSLGDVVAWIQEAARQTLPATISTTFQGAAKSFQSSLTNLWLLLIVAILVVYIVLGILYESYIHPLTILSGLPSAGFGALLTLLVFRIDLNIYAFVGLIMLIGIVEKNAIMQIDFALEAERKQGLPPMKAIYQGCLIRFRPIMMTTMAAMLGAAPIALGYGAGGEARQPLGLVVVGGLLFSQLVTLYLTPVVYTYMAGAAERFRGRSGRREAIVEQAPGMPQDLRA
jgi:HAE1 family hydrophobic/amphiphilic exporter-1